MKAKLTNKLVHSLQSEDRLYAVRDTEITGFLLKVSPSGGMVYYFDYRTNDGKRKSYRIGSGITPVQARDVATKLAADVAHGIDIQTEKQALREHAKTEKNRTLRGFLDKQYGPNAIKLSQSYQKLL